MGPSRQPLNWQDPCIHTNTLFGAVDHMFVLNFTVRVLSQGEIKRALLQQDSCGCQTARQVLERNKFIL